MSIYQKHILRKTIDLGGSWDFTYCPDGQEIDNIDIKNLNFDKKSVVPSVYDLRPENPGYRGAVAYKRVFSLDLGCEGMLRFEGLGMEAIIYVDGVRVGATNLPYSPLDCPVTSSEKREREIIVLCDNRFNYKRAPLQSPRHDYYAFGGIFREVFFHLLPKTFIKSVRVTPLIHESKASITVLFGGKGEIPEAIRFSLNGDSEREISLRKGGVYEFSLPIDNMRLWSPEDPYLYNLRVSTTEDDMIVRFGMREVKAEKGEILLNGKPLRLKGFNHHESTAQFGPTLSLAQIQEDLLKIEAMGSNFIRGSHYPKDSRILDLCDEMGILVWDESLGWQEPVEHLTDNHYRKANLRQMKEMILDHYNHPSIILWGFLNESKSDREESGDHYRDMATLCKELDPTRLITYGSDKHEKDLFLDLVDVISFNAYPGWYSKDPAKYRPLDEIAPRLGELVDFLNKDQYKDKPFILSEIGAGALYGLRDPLAGHWSEAYQKDYLEEVCTFTRDNKRVSGLALWQFCDIRTYNCGQSLARPGAFNNKGVLDCYRRPKEAANHIKSWFDQIQS